MSAHELRRANELVEIAAVPRDPKWDSVARGSCLDFPREEDMTVEDRAAFGAALVREESRRKVWRDLSMGRL